MIEWLLSGRGDNPDPGASLGGEVSTAALQGGLNNLFPDVTGDESRLGAVVHRCIYVRNGGTSELLAPVTLMVSASRDADDLEIGLDPAGKNGTAQVIADETQAPKGVEFRKPTRSRLLGLPSPPYQPGEFIAVWLRRSTPAGAPAAKNVEVRLALEADTYE